MKSGHLDGSAIYPNLHNNYIANVYPNIAIIKVEILL